MTAGAGDPDYSGGGGTAGEAHGGAIFLHNVDLTFDIDSTATISEAIADNSTAGSGSGTGSTVVKNGAGTLTLNGTNTYAGGTTVNAGLLNLNGSVTSVVTVNNGGTLGGTGTAGGGVTVGGGGTIAPGNSIGTLNVIGAVTFDAGSTFDVELDDAGNSDRIDATVKAELNGNGTVNVQAQMGTYTAGATYTILNAASVNGQFAGVTDNLLLFDFQDLYFANKVQLQLVSVASSTPFGDIAFTPNQQAIGGALDALFPTATGEMATVIDNLNTLPSDDARRDAMDQLGGELHGTLPMLGLQHTSYLYQLLGQQLGGPGTGGSDFAMAQFSRLPPVTPGPAASFADWEPASGDHLARQADYLVRGQNACYATWDGWAVKYALGGDAQSDGNATGLNWSMGGMAFGLHRWLDQGVVVGLFGAYGNSFVGTTSPDQTADADLLQAGIYARCVDDSDNWWLLAAGSGFDQYQTHRTINFGGIALTASAEYQGRQDVVYLERGWQRHWGRFRFEPMAALQYIHLHQSGFSETGAGVLNLTVDAIDTSSLRGILGGRIAWNHHTERGGGSSQIYGPHGCTSS